MTNRHLLHCWKGFQDEYGLKQFTCHLDKDHEGNCSPTYDEEISVEFSP